MKILRTLLYPVLFFSSLIFNHCIAKVDTAGHHLKVYFYAEIAEKTCEGMQMDYLINFGSFTVEDLRQGNVQSKTLPINLICDRNSSAIKYVVVTILPGSYGYLNEKVLLTSTKGIGIEIISSTHNLKILENSSNKLLDIERDGTFEEVLVFKPVYLGGEDAILGPFLGAANIEVRYL